MGTTVFRSSSSYLLSLFLFIALLGSATASTLNPYSGIALPQFELVSLSGKKHALDDYQGQVVLVNFWATWCPPCVNELPSMQRLKKRMANKPFSLLAINMGEDEGVLRKFLSRINVDFTILVDKDGSVARDWRLFAYPTSFLLDANGKISHVAYGELQWDSRTVMDTIDALITDIDIIRQLSRDSLSAPHTDDEEIKVGGSSQ